MPVVENSTERDNQSRHEDPYCLHEEAVPGICGVLQDQTDVRWIGRRWKNKVFDCFPMVVEKLLPRKR